MHIWMHLYNENIFNNNVFFFSDKSTLIYKINFVHGLWFVYFTYDTEDKKAVNYFYHEKD